MPRAREDERIARVREELHREEETSEGSEPDTDEQAGDPEVADRPMGVPLPDDAEDELPGFPREDPSQG